MESEFLSLCEFHLFVSAETYGQYFLALKNLNNPITSHSTSPRTFNRFRIPSGDLNDLNKKAVKLENSQTKPMVSADKADSRVANFFGAFMSSNNKPPADLSRKNSNIAPNDQQKPPVVVLNK